MIDDFLLAKSLFDKGDLAHSTEILNAIIQHNSTDINALMLRGLIFYRMQKWGDAMNDFSSVLELEPNHTEAKSRLEMAENILGYFTPDMFNP